MTDYERPQRGEPSLDPVSETRLAQVHPILAAKIRQLSALLAAENIYIRVTQGLRTWKEQDQLFAQGRTAPGQKVTNAKGGESFHNFGLAVDVVPDDAEVDNKFTPDWNVSHPSWKRIVELGQSIGLTSGALWRSRPDWPHFELTGRFPTSSPDPYMCATYENSGLQAVWDIITHDLTAKTPTAAPDAPQNA
jgi:peptidoglycan L-alanyl-D-glutamate endopeptidase CwlK